MPTAAHSSAELDRLRSEHYNARIVGIRRVHAELAILRVRPDDGVPPFQPGQYTTLGLGTWECRADGFIFPGTRVHGRDDQLIRRAYSIGCSLLDDNGRPVRCADCDYLEFYITLVRKPADDPPPLTPRLFALVEGDRLLVGMKPHGSYTLAHVKPADNVIFAGTGTGEAPHNAMAAELLARGHRGQVAVLTSARYERDLAYLPVHRELERRHLNYRYVALTTRELHNLDPSRPDYAGKRYVQDEFACGRIVQDLGWQPDPANTHVYLCGNPAMIGLPKKDPDGRPVYPEPHGMVEVLSHLGFALDEPHQPGNVHFEKYW